jgi:hypothetical protein
MAHVRARSVLGEVLLTAPATPRWLGRVRERCVVHGMAPKGAAQLHTVAPQTVR